MTERPWADPGFPAGGAANQAGRCQHTILTIFFKNWRPFTETNPRCIKYQEAFHEGLTHPAKQMAWPGASLVESHISKHNLQREISYEFNDLCNVAYLIN